MSSKKLTQLIRLLTILLSLKLILTRIKINKYTRMFVDEENRSNIFHGVNVVYKLFPFIPDTSEAHWDAFFSLNSKDIAIMKAYGFNLVRLGITWESIERKPGQYDLEHLEKMEKLVSAFGAAGIKVIIDAHQDMFSRIFCGEGVPPFYAQQLLNIKDENFIDTNCDFTLLGQFNKLIGICIPLKSFNWEYELNEDEIKVPTLNSCGNKFLKYHQSPELSTAYQAFYENKLNLQDKFIEFWKTVATRFARNPYVIGLDLWNEPWPGNIFLETSPFIPGYTTNKHVIPFYNKLYNALKKIDSEFIYMLETVPFPDTLPFFGGHSVSGFRSAPLGEAALEFQVLNLHSYCCMAKGDACETGEPLLIDSIGLCPSFHKRKLYKNKAQADKLGIPLIITEFGACSDTKACYNEMKGFLDAADVHLTSWAYWMYKPFGDHTTSARDDMEGIFYENGVPQAVKERALTRTYIQAYQGVPLSAQFDYETGFFFSKFYLDLNINAPSCLYLNRQLFYKNFAEDFELKVTNENFEDLENDLTQHAENGISYENYLNIKINIENNSKLENYSDAFAKSKEYKPYSSSFRTKFVSPIVSIGILPRTVFDASSFDASKKLGFTLQKSDNLSNTFKIIDLKNLLKNNRIDFNVEYFIGGNKLFKFVKINQDYKVSDKDTFIKMLTIETTYGSVKIQNLFNNRVEITIE